MPRASAVRSTPPTAPGVRARTRTLLLEAAARVFARKGAGAAAIHEIAAEAGVANGTFYNYFRTREEILEATSLRLAERLHAAIAVGRAAIDDPAERIAIGCRRFIAQAEVDPVWGTALLRVWHSTSAPSARGAAPLLADLRAGRRRGRLRYADEIVAVDLVQGTVLAGMRSVLEGRGGPGHAALIASVVLRGLGVGAAEADAIVARPLPPIPSLDAGAPPMAARRRRR